MRQLLTIYDIGKIPDINTVTDDFFARYKNLLSERDIPKVAENLHRFAEAIIMLRRYLEGEIRGFEPIVVSELDGEAGAFLTGLAQDAAFRGSGHEILLNRALLTAAISSVEVLFSNLARAIYERNTAALHKSGHEFTLEELCGYNSIEEAREALIVRRVESLIRPGIYSWAEWLQKNVNVDLAKIVSDWPQIREIFARRNAVVHADSKVDAKYLQEMCQAGLPGQSLAIGTNLLVTRQYLRDSLERLIALSLLMTHEVQANLYRSERDRSTDWLIGRQAYLARNELWATTLLISRYMASIKCRMALALDAKINGWIAQNYLKGPESTAQEVSAWDVDGLSEHYQMAKALLQGDMDRAASLISKALAEGRLTRIEIMSNPLYSSYRRIRN